MNLRIVFKALAKAAIGASLLSGCSTIAISSDGAMNNGERLISIQSSGYALLDTIPLWSGTVRLGANGQPRQGFALFRNKTRSDELYAKAQAIAKAQNCELTNVVFMNNYVGVDFNNCYGLLTTYDVSISAVLKEKK